MTTQQQEETIPPLRCEHNPELHKGLVLDKEKRGFKYVIGSAVIMFGMFLFLLIASFGKLKPSDISTVLWPLDLAVFFLFGIPNMKNMLDSAYSPKSRIHIPNSQANGVLQLHSSIAGMINVIVGLGLMVILMIPFVIGDSGLNQLDHRSFSSIIIQLHKHRDLKLSILMVALTGIIIYIFLVYKITYIKIDLHGLKIYTKGAFTSLLTKKKILCDQPWENLTKVYIKQRFTCYYQLHDEERHTFEIPVNLFADPCWLNYIATTCINLANAQQRRHFLTHLSDYAPTQGKIVTT